MTTEVRIYDSEKDRAQVDSWCQDWNMRTFPSQWLPQAGFIVEGVAAMWLYLTDSKVALLENVISNPKASLDDRDAALDAIGSAAEQYARDLGYKYILGSSSIQPILDRAKRHGYQILPPSQQIVKELV